MTEEQKLAEPETTRQLSEAEIELKMREFALDKRELDLKQSQIDINQGKKESPVTAVTASIVLGLVAAIVAMFGNWYQGRVNTDLEQRRFESALILKAVEPKDKNDQMRNLQFLVTIGLIKDDENKIKNIKPSALPELASSSVQVASPIVEAAWGVALEQDVSLKDAQDHLWSMARANGFNNSYIFKRPEGYRTVAVFKTENEAREQIPKARTINPTVSEPKKLEEWCPKSKWNQGQQYFECGQ
jgi:hypothetical protein